MSHISAIQGLRGVAVSGVLLFHVAPKIWSGGLLGVDMFFLISGYLMCSIMSKPLTSVEQFYFRRIRRIVPSYLFLIGLVLSAAAAGYVSSLDYLNLLEESKKPLKFMANIPNAHENNYFRQGFGVYYFFRHLWSLSTELQFYVLIPLFCFGLSKVQLHFRLIICVIIGLVSFRSQCRDDVDSAHMALHNRIWQFMAGFVAYYVQQLLKSEEQCQSETKTPKEQIQSFPLLERGDDAPQQNGTAVWKEPMHKLTNMSPIISIILHNLTQLALIYLLSHKTDEISLPFIRILILFLTGLTVVSPPTQWSILNIMPLVWLGDISYSVYLVHWPPIQWYFYEMGRSSTPTTDGCLIVAFAIVVGYLMEKFVYVAKITTSWYRLVAVLALCYLFIAVPYIYLRQNQINIDATEARTVVKEEDKDQLLYDIDRVWKGASPNMNPRELATFNFQLSALIHTMATCTNTNRSVIPTKYDIEKEIGFGETEPVSEIHGITKNCYETGNGTKNIVVIGNSHAQMMHFGVKKQFEGVYANLTVLSAGACPLIVWGGKVNSYHETHRLHCIAFRDKIVEVLRHWEHPIDIIIVAHAYQFPYSQHKIKLYPVTPDRLASDKIYKRLKHVYLGLAEIAREFVFIPSNTYVNNVPSPVDLLARKIVQNKPLQMFRRLRIEQDQRAPIDDRLRHINCSKCIHMEFENVWCNRDFRACDAVDYERRIGYFTDGNHVNAMGSLMYGRYMRRLYDENLRTVAEDEK